ncbi:MAG TPA: glycosyltransferase family 4 protein [Longimicrobiales bacterium]
MSATVVAGGGVRVSAAPTADAVGAGGERPLRFCMITTFYPPYNFGGDGIGIQRLSQALVRRGHHVTVVHDADSFVMLNGGEPTAPAPADGVEVIGLRSRFGRLASLLTHQTGRPVVHGATIRRILEAGDYDVVNFHNISLVGGPGLLQAGAGLKVMMAHEHWLICPTHVLWRHDREPCSGRECTRCVLSYRRPPQLWRYTGYLERQLEHVDLFIAMSEFSRAKHREFGFPREMAVLPYFLPGDGGSDPMVAAESPHARPYFLFVGRLERIKGLEDVIEAFRAYRDADLLVAGSGTHEAELRRQAAGLENVKFLGRLDAARLAEVYRHAIALVVPSAGYETFGIILIESFRAATPVIARRLGPFPEIVERAGAGELFSTQAELIDALARLQQDTAYRARLAANGRAAFFEHWSEDVVVPRYLELLRDAAERSGRVQTARLLSNGVTS